MELPAFLDLLPPWSSPISVNYNFILPAAQARTRWSHSLFLSSHLWYLVRQWMLSSLFKTHPESDHSPPPCCHHPGLSPSLLAWIWQQALKRSPCLARDPWSLFTKQAEMILLTPTSCHCTAQNPLMASHLFPEKNNILTIITLIKSSSCPIYLFFKDNIIRGYWLLQIYFSLLPTLALSFLQTKFLCL